MLAQSLATACTTGIKHLTKPEENSEGMDLTSQK
jgi:hypothetical protein